MLRILLSSLAVALLASACSKSEPEAPSAAVQQPAPPGAPAPPTFTAVDQALKQGAFDDAAARLLEMRAAGKQFSPQESSQYRKSLNEAYSQALEAAEKGDARAKAAIELIRANRDR